MNANEMTLKALKAAAPEYSTGRWPYVDVCITGRDADLEVGGHQGYRVLRVDGDTVHCTAECGQSIVGHDVCLNFPDDVEGYYERKREEYLAFAGQAVCDFPFDGEWDGDSWWLSYSQPFTAALVRGAEGEVDLEATFQAMYDGHQAAVAYWDQESEDLHGVLGEVAGWRDELGRKLMYWHCRNGPATRMVPYV